MTVKALLTLSFVPFPGLKNAWLEGLVPAEERGLALGHLCRLPTFWPTWQNSRSLTTRWLFPTVLTCSTKQKGEEVVYITLRHAFWYLMCLLYEFVLTKVWSDCFVMTEVQLLSTDSIERLIYCVYLFEFTLPCTCTSFPCMHLSFVLWAFKVLNHRIASRCTFTVKSKLFFVKFC